jgi:pimeloyl-ACP methyl ester carboxylesterase
MTEFLDIPRGRIADGIAGGGPLVLPAHGLRDSRQAYRFPAPRLAGASCRAPAVDIRGHGESRTGWDSYTRADGAGDILALIGHLGGPETIVGHSFAGGSAVIAATGQPELIEPGDDADILVVSGNSLTDPAAIHRIRAVYLRRTALAGGGR